MWCDYKTVKYNYFDLFDLKKNWAAMYQSFNTLNFAVDYIFNFLINMIFNTLQLY